MRSTARPRLFSPAPGASIENGGLSIEAAWLLSSRIAR